MRSFKTKQKQAQKPKVYQVFVNKELAKFLNSGDYVFLSLNIDSVKEWDVESEVIVQLMFHAIRLRKDDIQFINQRGKDFRKLCKLLAGDGIQEIKRILVEPEVFENQAINKRGE